MDSIIIRISLKKSQNKLKQMYFKILQKKKKKYTQYHVVNNVVCL